MSADQGLDKSAFVENDRGVNNGDGQNRLVTCDYCEAELELNDEELAQNWFICPECGELSHLGEPVDALDAARAPALGEGAARPWSQQEAACDYCGRTISLSDRQTSQGWFLCPFCHELGQLDDCLTCLSCGSQLELIDEEWDQGWYRCPVCGKVTLLVDLAEESPPPEESGPGLADRERQCDWVQLKQAATADEAAQLVQFLRANGVGAFARRGGGKGAFGLATDALSTFHVMVQENQKQLAHSLLEVEV